MVNCPAANSSINGKTDFYYKQNLLEYDFIINLKINRILSLLKLYIKI